MGAMTDGDVILYILTDTILLYSTGNGDGDRNNNTYMDKFLTLHITDR